jgi:hypothetical protein
MLAWAAAVLLLLIGLATYFAEDPMTVLHAVAELGAVCALFALVCAAEAWN